MPQFFQCPVISVEAKDEAEATDMIFEAMRGVGEIPGWLPPPPSFEEKRLQKAAASLLAACQAYHQAVDLLFAQLIRLDPEFYPSKSGQPWACVSRATLLSGRPLERPRFRRRLHEEVEAEGQADATGGASGPVGHYQALSPAPPRKPQGVGRLDTAMKLPKGEPLNDHCTRYKLPNGWFIDKDLPRLNGGRRYTLWEPGAGDEVGRVKGRTYRIAAWRGGADTLKAALALVPAEKEGE